MTNATTETVPAYLVGFHFECSCGERFRTVAAAGSCRKCRVYTVFGTCTHVVDTRTEAVVWGRVPDRFEYEAAEADAMVRWAEEKEELDFQVQMWRREGELYDAEMARREEEALKVVTENFEDALYDVQDQLMGY